MSFQVQPNRWRDWLIFDFNVSETSPVVKGTTVTVDQIVSRVVDGWTWSDVLRSHPELTEDDLRVCLAYATEEGIDTTNQQGAEQVSTAQAVRTWGDVIEYRRGLACLINIQENIVGYVGDVVYHVAERGIKETELFYDASESDIRLALQWLALDRPPLDQPIPVERGPWVPGSSHEKVLYQRLRDTLPDLHELAAVALSVTVKHWLADAQRFDECKARQAQPQATAEQSKPAVPPTDLPPGYAAIPDPAFDRLCYRVETGSIFTQQLAKTGKPNDNEPQYDLMLEVFGGWKFDPAKLAAWQAGQAEAAQKVSREFVEGSDIEASVGLGMRDPFKAYLTFIGVLAERVATLEARLAEQAESQHETASNVSTIRGTLFRTDVRISRLESAKPQPVAVKYPDFDMSLFPATVEEVRREEQRQAENPIEIPDELLDPARLLKPEPTTSEPDVPAGLLESDDGEPRYREADISVYPWVYGEAEYLTKNGIPASSVAEGLRLVVADAVKEVPGLNIKLAPADAVAVEWTTEPPKEDGGGWIQDVNRRFLIPVAWNAKEKCGMGPNGQVCFSGEIARYLMLPRPEAKS